MHLDALKTCNSCSIPYLYTTHIFIIVSLTMCVVLRYSACALWDGDGCGLTLASGTVFNKILLWCLTSDDLAKDSGADAKVKVQLTLCGHEARRNTGLVLLQCFIFVP